MWLSLVLIDLAIIVVSLPLFVLFLALRGLAELLMWTTDRIADLGLWLLRLSPSGMGRRRDDRVE